MIAPGGKPRPGGKLAVAQGSLPGAMMNWHFTGSYPRTVPAGHPPAGSGPNSGVKSLLGKVRGHFLELGADLDVAVGSSTGAQAL